MGTLAAVAPPECFVDALAQCEDASVRPSSWLFNTRSLGQLRKVKAVVDGGPLLTPDIARPGADMLLGRPIVSTLHMPLGYAVLVDASTVHVDIDREAEARILDQLYGDYDQIAVRVVMPVDVKTVNPAGLVLIDTLGPAA